MNWSLPPVTIDSINRMAGPWANYVLLATWQATAAAILILLIVWVGRKLPAPLRAALLILAVVKFILPPMVAAPTGIFRLGEPIVAHLTAPLPVVVPPQVPQQHALNIPLDSQITPDERAPARVAPLPEIIAQSPVRSTPAQSTPSAPPLTLAAKLMLLHATGALLLAGWISLDAFRLRRLATRSRALTSGPLVDRMIAIAHQLSVRPPRELLICTQPLPPMAFGLLRRRILLPQALLDSLDAPQIDAILAHELAHHRRQDCLITLVQLLSVVLWWFNPLVWLVGFELRRTREECCDDLVVGESISTPTEYCQSLLAAAEHIAAWQSARMMLTISQPMHPLGKRMIRIMDTSLTRVPRLSRKMIAVLLLLAAVLLPGVRLHGQASPATAPAPTKAPIAPAPADPSNPSNLPVPNGARLTGTVVHEDKSPAAGAQVFLLRRGRYIGTPDPLQVLTEPDGSFTIDGLARADYRLWAQAGNFVSRQKRYGSEIVKVTQAGGDVGPINLTLHPGREVDAIVTSATDGKPIPGARLHLTWTDTIPDFTTDSAGKCTIEALTAESWQIEATAAGRAKVVKKVNLESDPRSSVDFSLPEGGSISGKVVDANGKPIAKVGLGFYPSNQGMPIADTNTSTDGTYRLDNVPLDRPGHVDTFTKVYLEKTSAIKLSQADRDQQLNFTLEPKAFRSLDGTVIDPDHKPLAHATVTYYGSSSDNVHSVKTDPAGHFHLDGIEPAGTWAPQITVRSRGWAPQVVSLDSSSPSTLTVQMTEKGHRLAGRVMDTDHKPIAGAEVYAGFNGWPNLRGGSKTTDEQGRFAFDSLPADLGFEVQADGYSDLDDQRLTIDGPDVEIVLQKEGALIGRITDQNTGAPITRFNIKLRDSALAKYDTPYPMLEISRTLTGEDFNSPTGAFRFSSMKAGAPLTLAITADGYPMQFIDDVYPTPPGRSKPLEIRLAKNPPNLIHIAGKIVSADGKPLAGVEVRAITYVVVADSAFRPTYMFDFSMLKSGQLAIQNPVHAVEAAVTAADGTFWFPDLTGDHVDLAYWSEGVPQTRLDITALSAAERANLALKVQSPATVTGHLNRTVFPAISHLTLNSTSDPTWQLEVPVQPGADHFNIPNVPPGSYKLFLAGAAIPDSSPYRPTDRQTFWFPFLSMTRFTAADGQTCSVDFGTAGYTLHGHASSAGKPLANQKIGLIMADEPQNVFRVTTTDTQGLFNFEQVSPGKYDLVALDAAESFPDLYALRKSAHTLVVEVKDKNVQADLGK